MFIHSHSSLENHTRFQTKRPIPICRLKRRKAIFFGMAHFLVAYIRELPHPAHRGSCTDTLAYSSLQHQSTKWQLWCLCARK